MSDSPRTCVLFLCVANAARSQMAEGIARSVAPEGVEVFSAGSAPQQVHPLAVEAMRRAGIQISGHHSKSLDDVPLDRVDTVITLCADEFCPSLGEGVERMHWPMPDPAAAEGSDEERVEAFVSVADALAERIRDLFGVPA